MAERRLHPRQRGAVRDQRGAVRVAHVLPRVPQRGGGVSISRAFLPPLATDAVPDAVPTPVVDGPVRGPLPGLLVYVNTPELNLRAAPGTDQAVLAVLPERMAVQTLGHGERIGDLIWIDVHVPDLGLDGWVAKPYLSIVQPYRAPY